MPKFCRFTLKVLNLVLNIELIIIRAEEFNLDTPMYSAILWCICVRTYKRNSN